MSGIPTSQLAWLGEGSVPSARLLGPVPVAHLVAPAACKAWGVEARLILTASEAVVPAGNDVCAGSKPARRFLWVHGWQNESKLSVGSARSSVLKTWQRKMPLQEEVLFFFFHFLPNSIISLCIFKIQLLLAVLNMLNAPSSVAPLCGYSVIVSE